MALIYRFEEFELNFERLELRRSGALLKVDALVLRLLRCLATNAGQLVTKDELVEKVWEARVVADNAITVAIARLRKTLGRTNDGRPFVTTMYGRGYRLECEVTALEATDPTPPLFARARDPAPPFVGRERVIASLARALDLASDRHGRACAVIGEAGIGKSSTVDEFARKAEASGVHVVWGHCREAGDTPPLDPWVQILRQLTARTDAGPEARSAEQATDEWTALLEEPSLPPQAAAMLDTTFLRDPKRHRVFDSLARLLTGAAEQTPWLLIIEDLHCADAASLEFFVYLLGELPRSRLLVVASTRPAPERRAQAPSSLLMRVLGHASCERFSLDRLRREHVQTYVEAVFDDADGQLADSIFARSEGNPFFMAELTRQLMAADEPNASALEVSAAALDLVWQPIARLDPNTREVLSAAAVLGRSFELSRLHAVTELAWGELMVCLDEALATSLVVAARDSATAFAFGHELLRSVLYDALSPAQRRSWHLRITRALERAQAAGESIPASELAYHSHAALPESDPRQTIAHCRAAAAAAAQRFAGLDVVRYLRNALEALELVDGASITLRMNLLFTTALYGRSSDSKEGVRALNEVLRLARERGNGAQLVRAACMLNLHPGYKPLPGATPALQRALELIDPNDAMLRSLALSALGYAAPQSYSAARTRALFDQAVPLARSSGNATSLYAALIYKLWALGGPANREETAALVRELEALAREYTKQMPVLPLDLSLFRAVTAVQQGDRAAAMRALDACASRARTLGKTEIAWQIERGRVLARLNAGETAGIFDALATLQRSAQTQSILGTAPFWAFDRTVVARELGIPISLDDELRSAMEFDDSEPPTIWAMKVRSLAATGLTAEARAMFEAVPPSAVAELPCSAHYLGTLGHLAAAALLLDARDYLAALYPLLARFPNEYTSPVSFYCEGSVAHLLGSIAHALGRRDDAIAHLERAVRLETQAELPRCAARARLELAQLVSSR